MCGKIRLTSYMQQEIAHPDKLIGDLWGMLMTVVKQMELLLCNWTFCRNLRRRVCCRQCLKPNWNLNWSQEKESNQFFDCIECGSVAAPMYVIPPHDHL